MTNEASTTIKAAAVAEQGATVASEQTPPTKAASPKKGAPKGQKTANVGTAKRAAPKKEAKAAKKNSKKSAKPARTKETATARDGSKKAQVLALIQRPKGATLGEIMKATSWQAHSVRGFISGTLGTKMGLKVVSAKREDGERVYSLGK